MKVSNIFDPDSVGLTVCKCYQQTIKLFWSDLGPNCLKWLSADNTVVSV